MSFSFLEADAHNASWLTVVAGLARSQQQQKKKFLEWWQHITVKQQHWGGEMEKKGRGLMGIEKAESNNVDFFLSLFCAGFHQETKLVLQSCRIWESHRSSPRAIQVVLITHCVAPFLCLVCAVYNCWNHRACSAPSSTINLVTDHKFVSSEDPAQALCGHAPIFCTTGNHFT